jgi:hypothetical protein
VSGIFGVEAVRSNRSRNPNASTAARLPFLAARIFDFRPRRANGASDPPMKEKCVERIIAIDLNDYRPPRIKDLPQ